MPRSVLIEFRRDTAAHWTATNPTLAAGEPGYETDTGLLKIGDGVTAWAGLAYFSAAGGVTSLDTITGAITLVAGANVTISDNSPAAGQITIAATPGAGGFSVVDYVEFTASVNITATTEGTAQTVVTGGGFTADGTSHYLLECFSPGAHPASTVNAVLDIAFFEGATDLGRAVYVTPTNGQMQTPLYMARRFVPSAGSHTYKVAAWVSSGTGVVAAGTGGANALPGYIMVTKQI